VSLIFGILPLLCDKDEGLILVDAGFPNQGGKFAKELKDLSINPRDISLILLTHGHYEHIGSINEIKKLAGGKIVINQHEKNLVEQALKPPLPPGTNLWGNMIRPVYSFGGLFIIFPGTPVDLVLEDKEYPLEYHGIHGKVSYTPGHSSGSISLLLNTGDAFVGDLAMNGLPMRIGPGMPVFAEDIGAVKESWRLLLTSGARWIYPAHRQPFTAELLEKLL